MKNILKLTIIAISITFLFGHSAADALTLPKTAAILPPETILLVDIDNFSQTKTQFEKTSYYKLYKDPAMAAFVEDTKKSWLKKLSEQDKNEFYKTISDANVLPQQRLAVAFVINKASKNGEPDVIAVSQWGENLPKVKQAIDKTVEKIITQGFRRKPAEEYHGVNITTLIKELPPQKVPDFENYNPDGNQTNIPTKTFQPEPVVVNYCLIDDCLLVCPNVELLKFAIAHIKGAQSPTLAADDDYNTTLKAAGPYHDVDLYVNIKQLIKSAAEEDTSGEVKSAITNLGFDNVASLGCSVGLARNPGSSVSGKIFLKINGLKKGVCKMLDFESASFKTPGFIPTSTSTAYFLNLNIKKAFTELASTINSFSPQYAAMMYIPLIPQSPDGQPTLMLKEGFIDHLGSQIVITQSINKPFSFSSQTTESLVAVSVNNKAALEKSFSTLYDKLISPKIPNAKRELLGYTIYTVDLPRLPFFRQGINQMDAPAAPAASPAMPMPPKMAFTITDAYLIFSTEATIEQTVRNLASPGAASITSAKWFNAAKSAVPSDTGLITLKDNVANAEFLWWFLKETAKTNTTSPYSVAGPMVFKEFFNPALLPDFSVVKKYFGISTMYAISRPDGFFIEFKDMPQP